MNNQQENITRLPLVLLTYNMDKNISTAGIFCLLTNHEPDILEGGIEEKKEEKEDKKKKKKDKYVFLIQFPE